MAGDNGALGMYRDIFREMLRDGSDRLIYNDSKEHACVLIEELLKSAEKHVLVFCRNLGKDVWGRDEVKSALRNVLVKHIDVEIILQQVPEQGEENETYKLLTAFGVIPKITENTAVAANFIVVDDKAYRLEKDIDLRKGYACANCPEAASSLHEAFNNLRAKSKEWHPEPKP